MTKNKTKYDWIIGVDYDFKSHIGSYAICNQDGEFTDVYSDTIGYDQFELILKAVSRALPGEVNIIKELQHD